VNYAKGVSALILPILLVVILSILVSFSIGANDETMSLVAGSGLLSARRAVLIGAILNVIGAIFLSGEVSKTLGENLINEQYRSTFAQSGEIGIVAVSILLSMSVWLIIASYLKWPVSTTQTVVGSSIGISLILAGPASINFSTLAFIMSGWLISPILGFVLAYLIEKLTYSFFRKYKDLTQLIRIERIFLYLTLIVAGITNLSRGGNDIANAVSPIIGFFDVELIPFVIGGLGMGVGVILMGSKVVKNVGTNLVNLAPGSAFSAQASTAIIMLAGTLMGFPLSATHVVVSSIVGVAFADKISVNTQTLKGIAISWLITLPLSGILAIGIHAGLSIIF